ncbi:MAG: death-on-curing family protein [Candidatus Saccharibacteria bacterium]|nr:death-on-curing family protein [Candidatus Saccharibacteria bacterium]
MQGFTLEELLFLHFKIAEDFKGAHGVRDESRLQSIIEAPWQEAFGVPLYPMIFEKAAVYVRSIIGDHPFVDGNKRMAITASVLLLMRGDYRLTATPKELEDFAVQVAVEHLDVPVITAWLKAHSTK